jgi:hypothetical protein
LQVLPMLPEHLLLLLVRHQLGRQLELEYLLPLVC